MHWQVSLAVEAKTRDECKNQIIEWEYYRVSFVIVFRHEKIIFYVRIICNMMFQLFD